MFRRFQNLTFLSGILLIIILISIKIILDKYFQTKQDRIRIGIPIKTVEQRQALGQFFPDNREIANANYIELTSGWREFFTLQQAGLEPQLVLEVNKQELIGNQFHTLKQIDSMLCNFQQRYDSILTIEQIGESAFNHLPIKAVKISDFPAQNEDEPTVLFTAAHHANEPLGIEICLYIIDYLCNNYQQNQKVRQWINKTEIWFVPVINPDGYQLVTNNKSIIIWRKNLRDNNSDGKFTPEMDGVDLNRNYAFNWGIEGDRFPSSNYYPGLFPFSEPETQAIRDLAKREHFSIHLDFHSAGEVILYPVSIDSSGHDDEIIKFATGIARHIKKRGKFSHYTVAPMNNRVGQCSLWMYIVQENAEAAFWILDKIS